MSGFPRWASAVASVLAAGAAVAFLRSVAERQEEPGPAIAASTYSARRGDWVAVTYAHVPERLLGLNVTEYVCLADNYCSDEKLSLWVGLFPYGADRRPIGRRAGFFNDEEPYLATKPIGWKPLNSTSGTTSFHLQGALAPAYQFVLFANGTAWPIELAATGAVKVENYYEPQHLRLARVASPAHMRVSWTSARHDDGARVLWGTAEGGLTRTASATPSTYTREQVCGPPANESGWSEPGWFYTAVIGPFDASDGCDLRYRVGSPSSGWSRDVRFCAPTPADPHSSIRFVAYADVGVTYDDGSQYHWMEPFAVNSTVFAKKGPPRAKGRRFFGRRGPVLAAAKETFREADGGFAFTLHAGDLSYATGFTSKWDRFMEAIEPLSAEAPYMTGLGNHERDWPASGSFWQGGDSGGECGVPTQTRFLMPVEGKSQDEGWYSFEEGPAHIVVIDTEMDLSEGSPQFMFLGRALARVDRSRTPWLIVSGHRPMYSSQSTLRPDAKHNLGDGPWWPGVEALFVEHQVDLCLWGHVHNAEVTCPLINGACVEPEEPGGYPAPVHVILGNAGQSLSLTCVNLPNASGVPEQCCCATSGGNCPAACDLLPPWSRWRMDSFGYSTVEVKGDQELTVNFYEDCVGVRDETQIKDCKKFNVLAHSTTLRRRAGLRDAAPQELQAVVV